MTMIMRMSIAQSVVHANHRRNRRNHFGKVGMVATDRKIRVELSG